MKHTSAKAGESSLPQCQECGKKNLTEWVVVEGKPYCDTNACGETAQEEADHQKHMLQDDEDFEDEADEPKNPNYDDGYDYMPQYTYPQDGTLIQQKWFSELNPSNKYDHQILKLGENAYDHTKVMWYQLCGHDTENTEYLPEERREVLLNFIERLKWIDATNISWVRGGMGVLATLPQDFLLARFLRGGKPPPAGGRVQYYLGGGSGKSYTSMTYEVPPSLGHVCKIVRRCFVCGKNVRVGQHREHEMHCDTPRNARCNYVPGKYVSKFQSHGPHLDWAKVVSQYGCRVMSPVTIQRVGARVIIQRNRCEKHTIAHENIQPQLQKANKLWMARKTDFNAKKPACFFCSAPVKMGVDGVHINKAWHHYKCVKYDLYLDHSKQQTCKVCGDVGSMIAFDQVPYCHGHANAFLATQKWFVDLPQTVKAMWDGNTYPDDYGSDELDHSAELEPNPGSSSPNGWMPQQHKDLESLGDPCAFCLLPINQAERKEINGRVFHQDCAEALAIA